jgi:hypothetical protein
MSKSGSANSQENNSFGIWSLKAQFSKLRDESEGVDNHCCAKMWKGISEKFLSWKLAFVLILIRRIKFKK